MTMQKGGDSSLSCRQRRHPKANRRDSSFAGMTIQKGGMTKQKGGDASPNLLKKLLNYTKNEQKL